jgi:UDPglucose 6-dehydrogenase
MDNRIGNSHMDITKERGFGGHCFPKDTKAIVTSADKEDVSLSILKEAIRYNSTIVKKKEPFHL